MTYKITPKVIEGGRCLVQNYRSKKKPLELGTVRAVSAALRSDGKARLVYEVVLDRTTTRSWGWPKQYREHPLFLTVGDDGIKKV